MSPEPLRLVARPIVTWPGLITETRTRSPFSAGWGDTTYLLRREAAQLDAPEIVLQLAVGEGGIRNDGWIRADARPEHPGVIVSIESRQGPLSFPCDAFTDWQSNVRAIALGMEALRRVDRYGITKRGEQYDGWKAIGPAAMTADDAARILIDAAGAGGTWDPEDIIGARPLISDLYRRAARVLHPDAGGDPEVFARVAEAKTLLVELAR
jgi:hypothetical protein